MIVSPDFASAGAGAFSNMIDIKKRLQDEIQQLDYELKVHLPKEILRAREHGDLRENAEYKTAKERQSFLQARVAQLHRRLAALNMVNLDRIPRDKVGLGSTVTVRQEDTGDEIVYEIVVPEDSDPTIGRISPSSPIGKCLLGHEVGDTVEVRVPGGSEDVRDHEARHHPRPGEGRVAARVSLPALAFVSLAGDPAPAVAQVPAAPGVGQILGPGGREPAAGARVEPSQVGRFPPRPRQAGRPRAAAEDEPRRDRHRDRLGGGRRLVPAAPALRAARGAARPALVAPRPQAPGLPPPRPRPALPARHGARRGRERGLPLRPLPRPARGREGPRRPAPPLPPAPLRLHVRAGSRAAPGLGLPLRPGALVRRALSRPRQRGGLPLARGPGRRVAGSSLGARGGAAGRSRDRRRRWRVRAP